MQYKKDYAKKMLDFFAYGEGKGLPSFEKFAFSIGALRADLERWRKEDPIFSKCYDECVFRLCDMLTDGALIKRYDPSFVKFLLSSRYGFSEDEEKDETKPFEVKITVLDDETKGKGES